MALFIGIDQSVLHTGICILNEDASINYLGLIEPQALRNHERLAYIRDGLATVLGDLRFATGVMEGYSYGSVNKKFLLGEVGAVIKLALFDRCEKCFEASPKGLKKFVTSKGSASKDEVMIAIEKQWKVVIQDDNVADAYGLARIGYEIARPCSVMRHQLDVVKVIKSKDLKKEPKPRVKRQFKDAV